jgi:hypothetical protein
LPIPDAEVSNFEQLVGMAHGGFHRDPWGICFAVFVDRHGGTLATPIPGTRAPASRHTGHIERTFGRRLPEINAVYVRRDTTIALPQRALSVMKTVLILVNLTRAVKQLGEGPALARSLESIGTGDPRRRCRPKRRRNLDPPDLLLLPSWSTLQGEDTGREIGP